VLNPRLQDLFLEERMSQSQSPVTGIIDESIVILDFGKHEGKTVKDICAEDPEFYSSLVDEKGEGVYAVHSRRD
jgi:broad specificity phosphatase PhoE